MVVYESNVFDSDACHASAILSPIRDKYTELYLKGEEKGEEKLQEVPIILCLLSENSHSGAKMRSLGGLMRCRGCFNAFLGVF